MDPPTLKALWVASISTGILERRIFFLCLTKAKYPATNATPRHARTIKMIATVWPVEFPPPLSDWAGGGGGGLGRARPAASAALAEMVVSEMAGAEMVRTSMSRT